MVRREEEMAARKVCDECTQNCVLIHRRKKDPSPVVVSFLKLLYGTYDFSKFLYVPPKIFRTISALRDKQNYDLEDSSGQRWPVALSNIDGALAFRRGWNKFFVDHSLREGDTLVFNYITGSHFVVQIYGKTGCLKFDFPQPNTNQRKGSKTKGKSLAEDRDCLMICTDSASKPGSSTSVISGSDTGSQSQPLTKDNNTSSIKNGNGRLQIAPAEYDIEPVYMIDREAGYKHNEDRSCLYDLSNFETPTTRVAADGIREDRSSHPSHKILKTQPVACILNENPVSTQVASWESPAQVAAIAMVQKNNESSLKEKVAAIDKDHQGGQLFDLFLRNPAGGPAENTINSAITSKIVKFREAAVGNICSSELRKLPKEEPNMNKLSSHETLNSGKYQNMFNELVQSSSGAEKDNLDEVLKEVKSEPDFLIDDYSADAPINTCAVVVGSLAHLVLPKCLPSLSFRRTGMEKKVAILRGPDSRLWPVLYYKKYGMKALLSGWEAFCKSYNISPGDECVIGIENEPENIFKVDIVRK